MAPNSSAGLIDRFNKSYKVRATKTAIADFLYPAIAAKRNMALSGKLRRTQRLWLHFGCGEVADSRFLNVDARPFRHVDYVTKSPEIPAIPTGSAELIYACHVFEHISYFHGQTQALSRWCALLKPRGCLMLSVPDFDKVVSLYQRRERDFEWLQSVLMGGQDYPGNVHFALFTKERLGKLLTDTGFTDVQYWRSAEQENWPKDWSWDETISLNICATRPEH